MKSTQDKERAAKEVLGMLAPLYKEHLHDAGVGTISEIFDGDPPHLPNGTISQAWSVAEALRLLMIMKDTAPEAYETWAKA
jgi:glycogen debranching enzyme